ncbi:MAG TPA: glycoside hydrolase family 18 protein [Fibrobacteria bacterium]|nr:glycoside hydrolase family 18 protein [Fibrobacteria bacterium]
MLAILPLLVSLSSASPMKVVGYFPDWADSTFSTAKLDFGKVTHVAWSFAIPDSQGNLGTLSGTKAKRLDTLVKTAHAQGVKVVVSLGGGGSSEGFAYFSARDSLRAHFCSQVMRWIRDYQLDGADLDWEPPTKADTGSLRKLVIQLRDSLGPDRSLSMAVPCSNWSGRWVPIESIVSKIDWLGNMTYDITGVWDDLARYNSPLYKHMDWSIDWSFSDGMDYWAGRGVPKEKILGGVPFFGFLFPQARKPGDSITTATSKTYKAVNTLLAQGGWTTRWDSISRVPWATHPTQGYLTWDDPRSVAEKGRWLAANQYGGAIIWELTQDWTLPESRPLLDSLWYSLGTAGITPRSIRGAWAPVRSGGQMESADPFEIMDANGRILARSVPQGAIHVARLDGLRSGVLILRNPARNQSIRWTRP